MAPQHTMGSHMVRAYCNSRAQHLHGALSRAFLKAPTILQESLVCYDAVGHAISGPYTTMMHMEEPSSIQQASCAAAIARSLLT